MPGSERQSFEVFKAAISNTAYLRDINKSSLNQAQFMRTLKENKLTPQELLESIELVKDSQVRSLLITYLLSQNDYLESLNGQSLLLRLMDNTNHTPSRLNALVHQLDLKTLTPNMIKILTPEAAASIFCSVPHFHELTKEQIKALIIQYPKSELVTYWMNHFSSMPNAHYVIAHLMKLIKSNLINNYLNPSLKEPLITKIIGHLGLFSLVLDKFLCVADQEVHLTLAIHYYLNGHFNSAYVAYIKQLTLHLLDKNHSFSLSTIELFFFLSDKQSFKEFANKTTYLILPYLKNQAQEGNTSLFYHNARINIQRMDQKIQIPLQSENPFIEGFIKQYKFMSYFDYFLIYYQGNTEQLGQVVIDYIEYYAKQENPKNRDQALHRLSLMLTQTELRVSVKEAIFNAFLIHHQLVDELICPQLFLYDTMRTIHYFGRQGGEKNYLEVIRLCSLALKKIDSEENRSLIIMAKKALSEAQIELNFTRKTGFFSNLFQRIKRCWIYGWTGFFIPNEPFYVSANSYNKKTSIQPDLKPNPVVQVTKDLSSLLQEIAPPLTQEQLETLIEAMNLYSLQAMPNDEFKTREKLQRLFLSALNERDAQVYPWLMDNKDPFVANQFRLVELILKEKSLSLDFNLEPLRYITEELNCPMPEQKIEPILKSKLNPLPAPPKIITKEAISKYAAEASEYARGAWNWAESWAEGFFAAEDKAEEEPIEIEYVATKNPTLP